MVIPAECLLQTLVDSRRGWLAQLGLRSEHLEPGCSKIDSQKERIVKIMLELSAFTCAALLMCSLPSSWCVLWMMGFISSQTKLCVTRFGQHVCL